MKINESNFVEELSHRNEKALEYVMVHYGGLVKSVTHRYLNVLSQYEEECINDVFFAVWEHIDSYDSARNPFATKGIDDAIELQTQFDEEFSEETKQMLSCLKPQDRELFIKLYVEEKPFDEISKEMNTKKPVLYNRLFRSKKKLRALFPKTKSMNIT